RIARRVHPGTQTVVRRAVSRSSARKSTRRVALGARGRAGADLGPSEQHVAADRRGAARGSERAPARTDLAAPDRGASSAAAAASRAEPAVGARADDDDPVGAPRHLVAALLVIDGGRSPPLRDRGVAPRGARAGPPWPHQDAADGAL